MKFKSFEKEFAEFCETKHSIALANGSVAIELALLAFNIGKGDEVIVTSRSFIASASSVVLVGATPVFADSDPHTQGLSRQTIEAVLTEKTKAVILVHLGGHPCDMDPIMELAEEKNFKVIEDCAQAHGAKYKGRPVGSIGHMGAWSFCQDKILTTAGEGGALTMNDTDLWRFCWSYKDHGKNYDTVFNKSHPPGFRWLHENFGTNWRLTEFQAAIGRIILRKLPAWVETRRRYAQIFNEALSGLTSLRIIESGDEYYNAYYKYYCFVVPENLAEGWSRDRILQEMTDKGFRIFSGSCSEIYKEKAFLDAGIQPRVELNSAKELGETSIMFLVHPTRKEENVQATASAMREVMERATKI